MKRTRALLAAAALTMATLTATAPPATAGLAGGQVYNAGAVGIGLIQNWGPDWRNGYGGGWYTMVLPTGQWSQWYYPDTDGFYIGSGYCAATNHRAAWDPVWRVGATVRGPINSKIQDGYQWQVRAYRC